MTLLTEYERLARTFGWGREELLTVNLNAAWAAFVAPAVQRDLEQRLREGHRPGQSLTGAV